MVHEIIKNFILLLICTACLTSCDAIRDKVVELTTSSSTKSTVKLDKEGAFEKKQESQDNIDSGINLKPDRWTGQGTEFAGIKIQDTGMRSVRAKLAIYKTPDVKNGEFSSSMVSVEGGEDSDFNLIQAGWTVNPGLYKDNEVHFFIYRYTQVTDGGPPFCTDVACGEFVIQSSDLKLGQVLTPSDVGWSQTFLHIYIAQNQTSGDWYLNANSERIGYWKSSNILFSSLKDGATTIRIGGEVYTPMGWDTSPPMGTGVVKNGMKTRTCFVEGIKINAGESGRGGYRPQNPEIIMMRCYFVVGAADPELFEDYGFFFGGKGGRDHELCEYPFPPLT